MFAMGGSFLDNLCAQYFKKSKYGELNIRIELFYFNYSGIQYTTWFIRFGFNTSKLDLIPPFLKIQIVTDNDEITDYDSLC